MVCASIEYLSFLFVCLHYFALVMETWPMSKCYSFKNLVKYSKITSSIFMLFFFLWENWAKSVYVCSNDLIYIKELLPCSMDLIQKQHVSSCSSRFWNMNHVAKYSRTTNPLLFKCYLVSDDNFGFTLAKLELWLKTFVVVCNSVSYFFITGSKILFTQYICICT